MHKHTFNGWNTQHPHSNLLDVIKQAAIVDVGDSAADSAFVDALVGPMTRFIIVFAVVVSNVGDVWKKYKVHVDGCSMNAKYGNI